MACKKWAFIATVSVVTRLVRRRVCPVSSRRTHSFFGGGDHGWITGVIDT